MKNMEVEKKLIFLYKFLLTKEERIYSALFSIGGKSEKDTKNIILQLFF